MEKAVFILLLVFLFSCEKPKEETITSPQKYCWKCTTKMNKNIFRSGIQISSTASTTIAVINKCEMTISEARALEASLTSIETSIDGSLTTVVRKTTECKK